MFLGLDIKTWLGLSVLGAIVSVVGALFGIILKDYFFTRSFERWKQKQNLELVYQKFRDPLILAASELSSRTLEILNQYPTVYLREAVWKSHPQKQTANSNQDAYFQKYKLLSTAYRLSAFLGWLELYRQEITFLNPGNNSTAKSFDNVVERIRSDLADGQINTAEDWLQWHDTLIFREELRAIGESLIETRGTSRTVIGYGRYCDLLDSDTPNVVQRWAKVVLNFYLDLQSNGKDFRQIRLQKMFTHLVELLRLLDNTSVRPNLQEAYNKFRKQ
ncbi:MAG: hypothetical protein HYZ22_11275 [Chloroflexi bacterium]|nr:hypothetical protein [Chloroflexota bacterium]